MLVGSFGTIIYFFFCGVFGRAGIAGWIFCVMVTPFEKSSSTYGPEKVFTGKLP